MKWLMDLIKRIFNKKKVKLLEAPTVESYKQEKNRNDFVVTLKQIADLDRDDGNGYKIIQNVNLKDMI